MVSKGAEINIIAAISDNGVIGKNGRNPWYIPHDLKRFRQITTGHTVIMGRKTWESIGQALPGRRNIVLSRQPDFRASDAQVVTSLSKALDAAHEADRVFVIGGSEVYAEALLIASTMMITEVKGNIDGDVFFPPFDANIWREKSREVDDGLDTSTSFVVYERQR